MIRTDPVVTVDVVEFFSDKPLMYGSAMLTLLFCSARLDDFLFSFAFGVLYIQPFKPLVLSAALTCCNSSSLSSGVVTSLSTLSTKVLTTDRLCS